MAENGLGIEAAVTIRINKRRYLSWPRGLSRDEGGKIYQAGDTVRVSVADAKLLCDDSDGMTAVARIIEEQKI